MSDRYTPRGAVATLSISRNYIGQKPVPVLDRTTASTFGSSDYLPVPLSGEPSHNLRNSKPLPSHAAVSPCLGRTQIRPETLGFKHTIESQDAIVQENMSVPDDRSLITNPRLRGKNTANHHPKTRPRANSGDTPITTPRFLRTATSIPDYRTINAAYRKSSAPIPSSHTTSIDRGLSIPVPRRPLLGWKDTGLNSVRESLRSALTNSSSVADSSGTERSSIRTNRSSASDGGGHQPNWPVVQDDDMSVEDTIALYAEGFLDDPIDDIPSQNFSKPFTSSPLAVRSDSETLNVKIPTNFAPPTALSKPFAQAKTSISAQAGVGTSTLTVSTHDYTATPLQDRLKALIGPPRDRYGFKKTTQHIKLADYDAWNATYSKYLSRRQKKWLDLMKQHKLPVDNPIRFPPKSDKVKRYIRKGIPPEWRGAAWFFYSGAPDRMAKYPDLYTKLVLKVSQGGLSENDRDHIERDLFRTFPDHIKFKADESPHSKDAANTSASSHSSGIETPMILSLRRLLQAFAVAHPKIGYCQSLNFLAGYLLIFLSGPGAEEKAFHLLCILTSLHLPGTHGISLEGANVDISVFMLCLRDAMPALWAAKIDDRADTTIALAAGDMRVATGLPTVSLATTGWFMSAFTATLPVETACRVWDCLFYEGSKTLFRVGLAIFKLCEQEIRATGDEPMEVFQVVQTAPKGMLDANLVIETATKKGGGWGFGGGGGFGGLSQKVVERRRQEKRGLYKAERERVLLKALTMPLDQGVLEEKMIGSEEVKGRRKMSSLRGK